MHVRVHEHKRAGGRQPRTLNVEYKLVTALVSHFPIFSLNELQPTKSRSIFGTLDTSQSAMSPIPVSSPSASICIEVGLLLVSFLAHHSLTALWRAV